MGPRESRWGTVVHAAVKTQYNPIFAREPPKTKHEIDFIDHSVDDSASLVGIWPNVESMLPSDEEPGSRQVVRTTVKCQQDSARNYRASLLQAAAGYQH